jgi:hypothetical protein
VLYVTLAVATLQSGDLIMRRCSLLGQDAPSRRERLDDEDPAAALGVLAGHVGVGVAVRRRRRARCR